jgi:hypothetical protein
VSVDLYTQAVNANGQTLWAANGVRVCTGPGERRHPAIVSDGAGGEVIAWDDTRNGNLDIYSVRYDVEGKAAGAVEWSGALHRNQRAIVPVDRNRRRGRRHRHVDGPPARHAAGDIYARRINASGTALWTADGVGVCTAGGSQDSPVIVPDGGGGAIIAWSDRRVSFNDIYAQRINSAGASYWPANGVVLCSALDFQVAPAIVSDGASGAIVAWLDMRAGNYRHLRAACERRGHGAVDERRSRCVHRGAKPGGYRDGDGWCRRHHPGVGGCSQTAPPTSMHTTLMLPVTNCGCRTVPKFLL